MLSEATIQELRQILKKDYGREINQSEASEIARNLVSYFDLLAKVYHQIKNKDSYDNNDSKDN
jgi:hypothetical protein